MPVISVNVTPADFDLIGRLAHGEAAAAGLPAAVDPEDMAAALLAAHLILVRDCADVLPPRGPITRAGIAAARRAGGSVSLGGGIGKIRGAV